MVSEAQKRANAKYRREKVKQVVVRFYPNEGDEEAYAHLKAQPKIGEYVKRLVRADMERQRSEDGV